MVAMLPFMLVAASGLCRHPPETMQQIKDRLLSNYDKSTRPTQAMMEREVASMPPPASGEPNCTLAPPERVQTQFYIDYMSVDQKKQEYTVEGFLRVFWKDERLAFGNDTNPECVCLTSLIFENDADLWTPDLYFERVIKLALAGTGPGAGFGTLLTIDREGNVVWSRQSAITLRCPMHFGNIPFDSHSCPYTMGLYSQTASDVILEWLDPVKALDNWKAVGTSLWDITNMRAHNDVQAYSTGTYTYAVAALDIKRQEQGYITSYIIIAIFLVMVSFGGVFVSAAAVPARAAIAVVTLIVVVNTGNSARAQLPPFSYSTWMTDFLFYSTLFNLFFFFEFAAANFGVQIDQHYKKLEADAKAKETEMTSSPMSGVAEADGVKLIQIKTAPAAMQSVKMIVVPYMRALKDSDYYVRRGFPFVYLLFIIIIYSQIGNYPSAAGR
mmetsp:Transcript_27468/g.69909  ORF Transcript_27468/g.69909 Transcript_27468/m.69909 type:complete len:441 (+) Transcript_27468:14-1336(+)